MASVNPSLCVLPLLLMSWACMALGQEGPSSSLTCVKKLLPCRPFLTSPSPPETCCAPLTEALQKERQCLCDVFNNEALLKSFNVTQEQAQQLLKNCKATVDVRVCKTGTNGTSSAPPTSTPSTGTPHPGTGSTPPSKSSIVSKKSMWGIGIVLAAAWASLLNLDF